MFAVELIIGTIVSPWCEARDALTAAVNAPDGSGAWLQPGCRVFIAGLKSAAQHNGIPGVVEGFRVQGERWAVRLLGGPSRGKPLAVRARNLAPRGDTFTGHVSEGPAPLIGLKEHLAAVRRTEGSLVAGVQGASVSSSSSVEGVLLNCGGFHPHHEQVGVAADPVGHGCDGGSVRFVLLSAALEHTSTESSLRRTILESDTETTKGSVDNKLEQWSGTRLQRLVEDLKRTTGAELIVSSCRVTEPLAAVCAGLGVAAVQCVDPEELALLAYAAGAIPSDEIPNLSLEPEAEVEPGASICWQDGWGGGVVGTAASVKAETIGGKIFLHFQLLHPEPLSRPALRTLILRGPGRALLAMYARLLKRCIAALDACCCLLPASTTTAVADAEDIRTDRVAYNPLAAFMPSVGEEEDIEEVFAVVPGGMTVELAMATALEGHTGHLVGKGEGPAVEALRVALLGVVRQLHSNTVGGGAVPTTSTVSGAKRRLAKEFLESSAEAGELETASGLTALEPSAISTLTSNPPLHVLC